MQNNQKQNSNPPKLAMDNIAPIPLARVLSISSDEEDPREAAERRDAELLRKNTQGSIISGLKYPS